MESDLSPPPSSPPLGAINHTVSIGVPTEGLSPKSPDLPPRRKRPRPSDQTDQGYVSASSSRNGDISSSSDAPFFSSDDITDADAAKYVSPARKKQYRRAWYEPERAESAVSHKLMRAVTRVPKDSGVYMNSDGSNSSLSDGFEIETAALKTKAAQNQSKKMQAFLQSGADDHAPSEPARPTIPADNPRKIFAASRRSSSAFGRALSSSSVVTRRTSLPKTREEIQADEALRQALENSQERLDVSNYGLHKLPPEYFTPLASVVRNPAFQPQAYTDAACAPLAPELKVFLSNNQFFSIPASLFDLSYLTVLSLRNNNLTELPTAFSRLTNLRELNLDGNPIRQLPHELVRLFGQQGSHLEKVGLPVAQLTRGLPHLACTVPRDVLSSRSPLRIGATTLPVLYDRDGSLSRASPLLSLHDTLRDGNTTSWIDFLPTIDAAFQQHTFRDAIPPEEPAAPSLFEIALRSCGRTTLAAELHSYLPPGSPQPVLDAVALVQRVVEQEGPLGRTCGVCAKRYLIVRAEWIEVRRFDPSFFRAGSMAAEWLPYLRRACSWECARMADQVV